MDYSKKNAEEYDAHAADWVAATETNAGHIFIEKPAIKALLPECLAGKRVLCVGVGSEEEIEMLKGVKATDITAIDISSELLKVTKERFPEVKTHHMDMMALHFETESFDVIFSSLALHYANDWDKMLSGFYKVLQPGGALIFSTQHPVRWGKNPTGNSYTNVRGVRLTEHTDIFPGNVSVIYYNHPNVDSIHEALEHAGFVVEVLEAANVVSTNPRPDMEEAYKKFAIKNADRPLFLVARAIKK